MSMSKDMRDSPQANLGFAANMLWWVCMCMMCLFIWAGYYRLLVSVPSCSTHPKLINNMLLVKVYGKWMKMTQVVKYGTGPCRSTYIILVSDCLATGGHVFPKLWPCVTLRLLGCSLSISDPNCPLQRSSLTLPLMSCFPLRGRKQSRRKWHSFTLSFYPLEVASPRS